MFSSRRIVLGSLLAYLRVRGPKAVLLIHGNSSAKEVFCSQIEHLANGGFAVVAPDLPGHGASQDSRNPTSGYSFPGYARVLGRLMSDLGYEHYHVLGWSLGGHIGLEMVSQGLPVTSLLITGTPPVSLDRAGIASGFRWSGLTALAGKRSFSREEFRRYGRAMMGMELPPDHRLSSSLRRTDGRSRFWMVRNGMAGIGCDERRLVARSPVPLAIVQGSQDVFVRNEYLRGLRYRNIWKDGPVFLDAGHAPHWQNPAAFNDNMIEFFAQRYEGGANDRGHRKLHRRDAGADVRH